MRVLPKEELCLQVIEKAPDAILYADREGIIRLWNTGAERIFGYSADQALGRSLDIIIPERLRGRHWEGYRMVLDTGESRYSTDLLSVPAKHKEGHQLSSEFSIVMIKNGRGEISGFAAIMRDVTAQWEKEKKLKEKLHELEKKSD